MNSKGFTLVELVAIIVILAAIFLLSFPNFLGIAKNEDENKYDDMVENICLSGKTYMYSNMDDFSELSTTGSVIEIKVEELVSYGNVDKNIINVKTEKSVINDSLIYTVLDDYSLDCKYKD